MREKWNLIHLNIKKWKWLRFLNIFLASLLSLVGTISIVEFLMVLNNTFNVGYFICFILTFILSHAYSFVVNKILLIKIENKMNNVRLETFKMLDDYKSKDNLKSEIDSRNFIHRFENLSSKNQIKLLTYVKDNLEKIDEFEYEDLSFEQGYLLEEMHDGVLFVEEGRSKSRNIRNESMKKY